MQDGELYFIDGVKCGRVVRSDDGRAEIIAEELMKPNGRLREGAGCTSRVCVCVFELMRSDFWNKKWRGLEFPSEISVVFSRGMVMLARGED